MEGNIPQLLDVGLVVLLVLVNGFFVAAEFSILRAKPAQLRTDTFREKRGVRSALALIDDLNTSLAATQFGITIASITLGWWGHHVFSLILLSWFDVVGSPVAATLTSGAATALAIALVIYLHIVLGELAAKSIGVKYPESALRVVACPMLVFSKLSRPFLVFLQKSANLILRTVGLQTALESDYVHSPADLAMLVKQSTKCGILDKEEEQMLHGVFGLGETVAREIMTPRTDLIAIGVDANFEQVVQTIVSSGLSRFPVIGESVDDVLGVLLARDLMRYVLRTAGTGFKAVEDFKLSSVMREPYFVPGTKPIDDLLGEFKLRKLHMAVVLDEHGGVDGIVTLEDLLEEIVGEIFDESDIPEAEVVVDECGDILVDGGVLVSDINSQFQTEIPEGDYDTIAGFVYTALGRVPNAGDEIVIDEHGALLIESNGGTIRRALAAVESEEESIDHEVVEQPNGSQLRTAITVERVDGHRVERVRVKHLNGQTDIESSETQAASQNRRELPDGDVS